MYYKVAHIPVPSRLTGHFTKSRQRGFATSAMVSLAIGLVNRVSIRIYLFGMNAEVWTLRRWSAVQDPDDRAFHASAEPIVGTVDKPAYECNEHLKSATQPQAFRRDAAAAALGIGGVSTRGRPGGNSFVYFLFEVAALPNPWEGLRREKRSPCACGHHPLRTARGCDCDTGHSRTQRAATRPCGREPGASRTSAQCVRCSAQRLRQQVLLGLEREGKPALAPAKAISTSFPVDGFAGCA